MFSNMLMSNKPAAPSGGGGFTPAYVNPIRWWDVADATTIFKDLAKTQAATAAGDIVQVVADKSVNATDLTETITSAQAPLLQLNSFNGLPTLLFDGVDDVLKTVTGVIAQPFELWITMKINMFVNSENIIGFVGYAATNFLDHSGAGQGHISVRNTFPGWPGYDFGITYAVGRFLFNGVNSLAETNAANLTIGDMTTLGFDGISIQSGINLSEFIITPMLSPADVSNMWNYFSTKTGLF